MGGGLPRDMGSWSLRIARRSLSTQSVNRAATTRRDQAEDLVDYLRWRLILLAKESYLRELSADLDFQMHARTHSSDTQHYVSGNHT